MIDNESSTVQTSSVEIEMVGKKIGGMCKYLILMWEYNAAQLINRKKVSDE